ncbi:MAG: outer membrane lipoprotein-sorting protein, partial [Desulfuromonadaceae bacterium]|nr:outer membrane lipoprotein-sorting protein [Desulfuromonadaceae bacterium]
NVAREDDRWLWLPALNLKKRIAPGDKRTSFVGSDFYYEDVSGRSLDEDRHELIEETATRYVIRNTPKNRSSVEFSHYIVQIDKTTYLPVKAEYFDQSGSVYRVVEALEVATVQGYPTVIKAAARDLLAGSTTINHFTQIEYDLGLQERIFTERFLRRAPREVTR